MKTWIGNGSVGSLVDPSDARVSVLDHGFTVGDGVFETIKVTPFGAFALSRHVERLIESARRVGQVLPDGTYVRHACEEVIAVNRSAITEIARLRVTWTSGSAPLGSDRSTGDPTLVVALMNQNPWPGTTSAITIPWVRNPRSIIAGTKSTSYAENVVALMRAHQEGASEAILGTTDGRVCEGTGTNVFVVIDGEVMTPTLGSGCLAGITRQLVLEWFGGVERDLPLVALQEADEVFLTSSTRDVHPVVRIDERRWGHAGPRSSEMRQEFLVRARADLDP